jgi:hypothetical protein
MLMASNFILNGLTEADTRSIPICPFVDKVCNVISVRDVCGPLMIPDISASAVLEGAYAHWDAAMAAAAAAAAAQPGSKVRAPAPIDDGSRFSMTAGDFNELYGPPVACGPDKGKEQGGDAKSQRVGEVMETESPGPSGPKAGVYDAVVTCFFIDTAPVVIDYLATIRHALRPGGVWINFGPLLYHWQSDSEGNGDTRYDSSIELSWEELREVVAGMGFRLLTHRGYKAKPEPESGADSQSQLASASPTGASAGALRERQEEQQEQGQYLDNGTVRVMPVAYTKPTNSLMWTQYNALFFTAERL